MAHVGEHRKGFGFHEKRFIDVRIAADGRSADRRVQPAAINQAQQRFAGVLHDFHGHARLLAQQVRHRIGQHRHGAHDGADGQASACAAGDCIQFVPQLVDVCLDQTRKAHGAQPSLGRD
ncbi:hypothetical protein G6F65_021004 [Rhizopus arrhizus]|nr:hypothetical protein G6F65_021004 [Rhizopus arrhizus]